MIFNCFVSSCRYNSGDGDCQHPYGPTISEDELTATGFLPMCRDYQEREGCGENAVE